MPLDTEADRGRRRPPDPVLDSRPTDQARTEARVIDESATGSSDAGDLDLPLDLDTATQRALATMPGRSSDPIVCPFLRAGTGDDLPPETSVTGHRCLAISPAVTLTERQRLLVCEAVAHTSCPRHARGEAAVRAALAPGLGRRGRTAPVAIGTAVVLLVAAAAVAATSGLSTMGGDAAGEGGVATPKPAAGSGTDASTDTPGAKPSPSPAGPGSSALPGATVVPLPTVRPTLVATRDLPAAWRGLEACPAPDGCYLYVVKRGDTFRAVAARFETTSRKLRKLNPALKDPSTIRVGSTIRVPPPPS